MQSSLSINGVQPNFQAKVAKHFIDDAHKLFNYKHINKDLKVAFDEKVIEFENFGFNDYYIKYKKTKVNDANVHNIVAAKSGDYNSKEILLTSKDQFRKAIEKFTHISKYEFTQKMKQALEKK